MSNPTEHNEQGLLLRLQAGDTYAFEMLYNSYKHRLSANFIKLLRDDELAKDALQDLFVRVWNGRASIDPEQSFRAFLFRIAKNLVIDYYRKAARDKSMQEKMLRENEISYQHVEEQLVSRENIGLVRSIIDKLPEQQHRAYMLHKIEGKSYNEISELMGISPSTINKHIYMAHRFVKDRLAHSPLLLKLLLVAILSGV